MLRSILRSKIHRAIVTHVDIDYEGSISIPKNLLGKSDIAQFESVEVWNVTNGNRFQTYAIESGSDNEIAVNGAAAHLCNVGDILIIASFGYLTSEEILTLDPKVLFLDENNKIKFIDKEIAGPSKR